MYETLEVLAWIPLALGAMSALGSLGGSFISAQGAAGANAANVAMQTTANQQNLAAQNAQHAQNTAFMEDSQAHQLFSQHMSQEFNQREAAANREWSANQAQHQMDFQERMANTAYQRAMNDMRQAGLNPMLAYQQGGAAPGPGAMGSGSAASSSGGSAGMASSGGSPGVRGANILNDKEAIGRAMGNLVTSAMGILRSHADIDFVKQKEAESKEVEKNVGYDSIKKDMETIKIGREAEKVLEEKELIKAQTKNAKTLSGVYAGESENMDRYGRKEAPDTIERLLRTLQEHLEKNGAGITAPPGRKYGGE